MITLLNIIRSKQCHPSASFPLDPPLQGSLFLLHWICEKTPNITQLFHATGTLGLHLRRRSLDVRGLNDFKNFHVCNFELSLCLCSAERKLTPPVLAQEALLRLASQAQGKLCEKSSCQFSSSVTDQHETARRVRRMVFLETFRSLSLWETLKGAALCQAHKTSGFWRNLIDGHPLSVLSSWLWQFRSHQQPAPCSAVQHSSIPPSCLFSSFAWICCSCS